ncbi:hypothetical protein M9458_037198, partial [Cirrhinus mrigala]
MKPVRLGEAAVDLLIRGARNSTDAAQGNTCRSLTTLLLLLLCLLLAIRHHRPEKDCVP